MPPFLGTGINKILPVAKPIGTEIPSVGQVIERMSDPEIDYNLETEHNDPIELTEEDQVEDSAEPTSKQQQDIVSNVEARYNDIL